MAALLTQDMGNQDKTIKNIAECRGMGIEILPPGINESHADFSVVEGRIRFGLAAVKNVGIKAVDSIIEERDEGGSYSDLVDFCTRVDGSRVNKRVLEGLIECGAFDFTGVYRSRLHASVEDVMKFCGSNTDPNQLSIFGSMDLRNNSIPGLFEWADVDKWDEKELLIREKEALGFYITAHPLSKFEKEIASSGSTTIQDLPTLEERKGIKVAGIIESSKIKWTKKGDKMAILRFEDLTGSVDVVVFPDLFNRKSGLLKSDEALLIEGNVELGESSANIIARDIQTLSSVRQASIRALEITLKKDDLSREMLEDLREIVFKYPGECGLRFRLKEPDRETLVSAGYNFNVVPCAELIAEMETLTGQRIVELEDPRF